ncbi:MAG TPA: hypothetical protein VMW08_02350 [Acidimicrobiales bacterium]|nr:hypothetical protein [Acidimicrobiales bacterium]
MTSRHDVVVPGDATDEEAAAIVAAIELSWPAVSGEATPDQPPRWRFAGRWWAKPVPLGRDRP